MAVMTEARTVDVRQEELVDVISLAISSLVSSIVVVSNGGGVVVVEV